jgi:hypothetical protein
MYNRHILGLTIGSMWLTLAGMAFGAWGLFSVHRTMAEAAGWVLLLGGLSQLLSGVMLIVALRQTPNGFGESTPANRALIRPFLIIFVIELFTVAGTTVWFIHNHHYLRIAAFNLIIIGLHFFPLAKLFQVPRYYGMGTCFCLIPLLTLWLIPHSMQLGAAFAWDVIPALGCALAAIITAAMSLQEARSYVELQLRP